jgi:hypothetical protein
MSQIPNAIATAPSKLAATGQISAQIAPLLGQQLGGKTLPLGVSFLSTTPRASTTPLALGSDTYKLLSAFAGRPVSPSDRISNRPISLPLASSDLRSLSPTFRLEDLDQIKLGAFVGPLSDPQTLQKISFSDSAASKIYSQIEDRLAIGATAVRDGISNVASPLWNLGSRSFEFLHRPHQLPPEHPKKHSEPNLQIYERPERDGRAKPNITKQSTSTAQRKEEGLLQSFASALLAIARRFR